jgi:hypothetical protein
MDFNKELQLLKQKEKELIDNAESKGYKFINNQFTKEEFIPVIEIYAYGESTYESYGRFMILKKTIPLTKEQLDRIKSVQQTKENLIDNFIYNSGLLAELDNTGTDTFYEILSWVGELETENIERIVENPEDEYQLQNGQNLYLEFFFESEVGMRGYISVYDLPSDKLEKQDNVDLTLKKYLTWN